MLFRSILFLLILYIVLVVNDTIKNKVNPSLTTISKKLTKSKPSLCKLPREIGPCRDAKQRFYYNSTVNECELFTYGGCRGNKNNFHSLNKCRKICKV